MKFEYTSRTKHNNWTVILNKDARLGDKYLSLDYKYGNYLHFRLYDLVKFIFLLENNRNGVIGQLFKCDLEVSYNQLLCVSNYNTLLFPLHDKQDLIKCLKTLNN